MNVIAHIIAAVAVCAALNALTGTAWSPAIAAVAILGALAPDVDHEKTKAFLFTSTVIAASAFAAVFFATKNILFSALVTLAAVGAIFLLKPRHRGITHSVLAAAVFSLAAFLATNSIAVAENAFAAYASHLVLDRQIRFV